MTKIIQPRFIRLRDCHHYLGMDRNRFTIEVRPNITIIPIGAQGKACDRLDLDEWADKYKEKVGIKPIKVSVTKQITSMELNDICDKILKESKKNRKK